MLIRFRTFQLWSNLSTNNNNEYHNVNTIYSEQEAILNKTTEPLFKIIPLVTMAMKFKAEST